MKVFTSKQFEGHWPVPVAAVIVAETIEDAATALSIALTQHGLTQVVKPEQLVELNTEQAHVVVLSDGEY